MYLNVYNVHIYIIYVCNVYIDVYNVHIYRKFYPFPDEWIYGEGKSSSETWLCFIYLYVLVPRVYIYIQDIHVPMYTYIPSA